MRNTLVGRAVLATALAVVSVAPAGAQIFESVGIRAQGMGGAFVAVADDASATWWNPAGLAGGAYVNSLVEWGATQDPRVATDAGGAALPSWRAKTRGIAVAYPALGLSYYRLRVSEIQPIGAIAGSATSRQDQGLTPVRLHSLVLQQFGATVGQSIGGHFVVGSTLKLVRGALGTSAGVAGEASLDRAAELDGSTETRLDLDVGALAQVGAVRAGVVVKNVRQPAFGAGADRLEIPRQARLGVAVTTGRRGSLGPVTVAFDADLTRTPTATGDQRHVAGGAEAWLFGRSLGLRGGVSGNTVGDVRPAAGAGASLALRGGMYVDGQVTVGSDTERKGWGLAFRLTF
jgi:hypothetical protein